MPFWKSVWMPVLASAGLALTACSSVPLPQAQNLAYADQYQVRSAGLWDLAARDVVAQTLDTLQKAGADRATPIHVQQPQPGSGFERGWREFVTTKLVQSGATVLSAPEPAGLLLTYQAQAITYLGPRPQAVPGQSVPLADGLTVVHGPGPGQPDRQLPAAPEPAAAGGPGPMGATHTVLTLTTTVARGSQYLARRTDVYYLEDAGVPLFLAPEPGPEPFPVKAMKVVEQ